jgi:hypothetical protein
MWKKPKQTCFHVSVVDHKKNGPCRSMREDFGVVGENVHGTVWKILFVTVWGHLWRRKGSWSCLRARSHFSNPLFHFPQVNRSASAERLQVRGSRMRIHAPTACFFPVKNRL